MCSKCSSNAFVVHQEAGRGLTRCCKSVDCQRQQDGVMWLCTMMCTVPLYGLRLLPGRVSLGTDHISGPSLFAQTTDEDVIRCKTQTYAAQPARKAQHTRS